MMIDYERAKREGPKLKRRLTLALKKENPRQREVYVYGACVGAVIEWEAWGAWPDNWSRWQRALDDVYGPGQVDLQDLPTAVKEARAAILRDLEEGDDA